MKESLKYLIELVFQMRRGGKKSTELTSKISLDLGNTE